jgi:hypothetical protein
MYNFIYQKLNTIEEVEKLLSPKGKQKFLLEKKHYPGV